MTYDPPGRQDGGGPRAGKMSSLPAKISAFPEKMLAFLTEVLALPGEFGPQLQPWLRH